jgi:hypothetical protein
MVLLSFWVICIEHDQLWVSFFFLFFWLFQFFFFFFFNLNGYYCHFRLHLSNLAKKNPNEELKGFVNW